MSSSRASRLVGSLTRTSRPRLSTRAQILCPSTTLRPFATNKKPLSAAGVPRPSLSQRLSRFSHPQKTQSRSIFIQTESTPNPDALKFLPNHRVLPEGISTPFIEYLSPRDTISPPYRSQLASQLMAVDGVTSVFYGTDFITVTKAADVQWAHVRPEIFALITEAITSGQPIVNVVERKEGDEAGAGEGIEEVDSLAYDENDSEVVGMIKELLETRIRPAIQEDGGDIEFRGFQNGQVMLKLRGACRTCDSSTVTLKNGIESMLKHYIEEVESVHQVTDPEEEIAIEEFAKFEEKLKAQKREANTA
ncbi:HIRA-interacting protein 5 [Sodiomyces alkalinus F11]|uniref:HIRA-interacting protein 5 n=1 Tax=Sodiomyces alkalinus (strain CBS 110278 / VKM F-3762 / F11) TaxID=1314773 RepID=A0A3N2Q0K8_SODAK|nr:HIRA-interacting protein 5 [Sodiomyces alkalinus F11]ROT40270.1 HIRA-interacting protein 5 [Sodiomyces alkalinus F11]